MTICNLDDWERRIKDTSVILSHEFNLNKDYPLTLFSAYGLNWSRKPEVEVLIGAQVEAKTWMHSFLICIQRDETLYSEVFIFCRQQSVQNYQKYTKGKRYKLYTEMSTNPNIITLPKEPNPLFKFEHELTGNTRVFSLQHQPHLGLLCLDPEVLMIAGLAYKGFNPSSVEALMDVREGDFIQVNSDPESDVFKKWAPPEEFGITPAFSRLYKTRMARVDGMEYPILVADEAL